MFVSLTRVCIVYVVKEVAGGLGRLMDVAHNGMHARAIQTSRKKAAVAIQTSRKRKLLVAYISTNSCSF